MHKTNVHEAERRLDATINHLKMQLAELRDEDVHIANRIKRLTKTVDELEEEYDKHFSWCTSPGLSTSEPNDCFRGYVSTLAPAVTESVVKAASTSKLRLFYESSTDSPCDVHIYGDEQCSTPSSPSSRRSVPAMYEPSVLKSKSVEFVGRGRSIDSEVVSNPSYTGGRKMGSSLVPQRIINNSISSQSVRSPSSRGYERAMTESKNYNGKSTPSEPRKEPVLSSSSSSGSMKKRHSFDILRVAGESFADRPGTSASLPRSAVPYQRHGSDPYACVPNITYSPELNPYEENGNGLEDEPSTDFLVTPSIPASTSLPIMRSASTGKMSPPNTKASTTSPMQRRITDSLPRNTIHPHDMWSRKSESPIVSSRRHEIISQQHRVCQSLPRGMNPKMLQMFSNTEKDDDPDDSFTERSYALRSKSYEDLDKFAISGTEVIRSRTRESKRWKLPFFNKGKREKP